MLSNFVNIQTLYAQDTDRVLPKLQQLYANHASLLYHLNNLVPGRWLKDHITGKKIVLKPNWVKHPRYDDDAYCLCTNPGFILGVLELVLQHQPAQVLIGDAPIQGAVWHEVVTPAFTHSVQQLSIRFNIPVVIKDFRRVIYMPGTNRVEAEHNPITEYVIADVGKKSYLEPITPINKNPFRVAHYNPDTFKASHRPGVHKYCIAKALFDADTVLSLPKVKTHQKTGITCALKNIVGFNGDKDYLPHHRIGGAGMGGDNYPGKNIFRYWSELISDMANRNKGKFQYRFWQKLSSLLWRVSFPGEKHQLNGAWYGNDTTWRMVMDLNTIIRYGKYDGTIAGTPQRVLYSISDGIIAGQGDGPLLPEPLPLGIIAFSDNAAMNDICMAALMKINTDKLPLLRAAAAAMDTGNCTITVNGKKTNWDNMDEYAISANMPPGWKNYNV
ncbi:MAG TPA: DUF362 domain-containing protein [Ferruginibacter sp.]|nr:DUF362 domain-containing protein [Ferruginibacter sp.]HMP19639.1 DUF362 domain-containing protein [Ferruginibacter sp.]